MPSKLHILVPVAIVYVKLAHQLLQPPRISKLTIIKCECPLSEHLDGFIKVEHQMDLTRLRFVNK